MTRRSGSGAYAMVRRYAAEALTIGLPAVVLLAVAFETAGRTRLLASTVAIGLLLVASRQLAKGDTWERGAKNERRVGKALEALRSEGWVVVHDVRRDFGNIDHIVAGPGGIFTVETKSRRYEERALGQAWGHARWLSERIGVSATPVLCIVERDVNPHTRRGVSVLPLRLLVERLRAEPRAATDQNVLELIASL